MTDYSDLVRRLQEEAKDIEDMFLYKEEWYPTVSLLKEAAEAIKILSKKKERKPTVKRLPCTCGRKQLDTWYTPNGYYLRCSNCGNQTEIIPHQCNLNAAWNTMIERKMANEKTD